MLDSTQHSAAFPTVRGRARGYARPEVDAFLDAARGSFESVDAAEPVSSGEVRAAVFPLVRGGYEPTAVDAALTRIEDAFAERERERALTRRGARAWLGRSRALGQEILERLRRPAGRRFDRVGALSWGYRRDEVDDVAVRIAAYLERGDALTVDQVRSVAFRLQRGGYRESQVDAVLDGVVDVMLSVR